MQKNQHLKPLTLKCIPDNAQDFYSKHSPNLYMSKGADLAFYLLRVFRVSNCDWYFVLAKDFYVSPDTFFHTGPCNKCSAIDWPKCQITANFRSKAERIHSLEAAKGWGGKTTERIGGQTETRRGWSKETKRKRVRRWVNSVYSDNSGYWTFRVRFLS